MYTVISFACFLVALLVTVLYPGAGRCAEEEHRDHLRAAQSLLNSTDAVQLDQAFASIVRLGPRAASTVPTLLRMLSDRRPVFPHAPLPWQPAIQDRAADCLVAIGKSAVQPLTDRLAQSADDDLRIMIIKTLGQIGTEAHTASELLLNCAASDDEHVRYYAVDAFAKVGRDNCIVVPQLIRFLDDKDPNVRSAAVQALGRLGRHAALAVPKLVELLDSDGWRAQWHTPDSAGAVQLRVDVADTLAKIGVRDALAVAKLTLLLKHGDPTVRVAAAHAHCRLSPDIRTGLAVLETSLNDRSHGYLVVRQATEALADLGDGARPIAARLVGLLRDEEAIVRCAAVSAVASVQPPGSFDLLVRSCQDTHEIVRMAAYQSVARLMSQDSLFDNDAVVELFVHGLDDRSEVVRASAMNGLGALGERARAAVPRLMELVVSDNDLDRAAAKRAIDRIAAHDSTTRD